MTVSTVTNNTTPTTTATDQQTLAGNFNTFLTLLTSQLQNQDPLSPMDSTQFTQQLVEFSQVEQQIKTNDNLTSLASQFQAASASAALSYLGRDVLLQNDTTNLSGGQASWAYNLPTNASTVQIDVRDSSNRTLFTTTGETTSGDHLFSWDGKDSNGNTMPDGDYKLVVTATDAGGNAITPTLTTRQTISGLDFSTTPPQVLTASGSYDFSAIRAVLDQN